MTESKLGRVIIGVVVGLLFGAGVVLWSGCVSYTACTKSFGALEPTPVPGSVVRCSSGKLP